MERHQDCPYPNLTGIGDKSQVCATFQIAMYNTQVLRKAIRLADIGLLKEIFASLPNNCIRLYHDWTPLHTAVKLGNRDVVATIIEAGEDVNALTDMYQTSLDIAVERGHTKVAELLKKHGALNGSLLSLHPAVESGDLKMVKHHLKTQAGIDKKIKGYSALGLACQHRQWAVAKFLLSQKSNVTLSQTAKTSIMQLAAANGAPLEILEKMLKLGADINSHDEFDRSALSESAYNGHTEVCDWLIKHGADLNFGDTQSTTPVHYALRRNHIDLAVLLIDRGAKATLHQAAQCNHLVKARLMLSSGSDANHDPDSCVMESPLAAAIYRDFLEMVELLLEFRADPNIQRKPLRSNDGVYGGETALHVAVYQGSAKMVKLLLAHGADPDIPNGQGFSAIEEARQRCRIHLVTIMEASIDKKLSLQAAQTGVEQLYTVQKVAELLSVDDTFVSNLITTRQITSIKLNADTLRIPAGSVQRYLKKKGLQGTPTT